MGNENLLGTPAVEDLCGLRPVRETGQDLCLGGVGLQKADVGQHLLLLRPVVVDHAAVFHPAQHALDIDGHHGVLGGEGNHFVGDISAHQARQMPDGRVNLRHLVGAVGGDHTVHGGGPALPVRRVVDVLGNKGLLTDQGVDCDVGGLGKGLFQIHLRVRLGQHGDLVSDVGGGVAGVVHGAADGLDRGPVVVHIGVPGHLTDNQGIKLAHFPLSFLISSSASTNVWNSGLHRWKRPLSIMAL